MYWIFFWVCLQEPTANRLQRGFFAIQTARSWWGTNRYAVNKSPWFRALYTASVRLNYIPSNRRKVGVIYIPEVGKSRIICTKYSGENIGWIHQIAGSHKWSTELPACLSERKSQRRQLNMSVRKTANNAENTMRWRANSMTNVICCCPQHDAENTADWALH